MGTFVIIEKTNKKFQFSLKAENGRAILFSVDFDKKEQCIEGIESVKLLSGDQDSIALDLSTPGAFFFTCKGPDEKIIAHSKFCSSKKTLLELIAVVKRNVVNTTISDHAVDRLLPVKL